MNTPEPIADVQLSVEYEDRLHQLLQQMLAGIRRYLATPLQEVIDSVGISSTALRNLSDGMCDRMPNWRTVEFGLNRLVDQALHDDHGNPDRVEIQTDYHACRTKQSRCGLGDGDRPESAERNGQYLPPLAMWLDKFFNVMRDVHPRAIEIVQLKLDGYPCRDVAERLGMGRCLVQRMLHDLHSAWHAAGERSES